MEKQQMRQAMNPRWLQALVFALTVPLMAGAIWISPAQAQQTHVTFLRPSDLVVQANKAVEARDYQRASLKSERALNTPLSRSDERMALRILCISVSAMHDVADPVLACARDEDSGRIGWVRVNSKGQKLAARNKLESAISTYREGLKFAPDSQVLHDSLARALARQSMAQAEGTR